MIQPQSAKDLASGLEPLVHPNFFAGQLLTDRDLNDLLSYIQGRFALLRYREGWGVVCGMAVRSNGKGKKPLRVTKGYAVDCAGRDLVLDCDVEVCLPPPDRELLPCSAIPKDKKTEPGDIDIPDGGSIPEDRLGVFDIIAYYVYEDFDPAIVLSDCKRQCEDSRRKETVKFDAVPVDVKSKPKDGSGISSALSQEIQNLLEGLKKLLKPLEEESNTKFYAATLQEGKDTPILEAANAIEAWILRQLQTNPRLSEVYPGLKPWWEGVQKKPYNTPWKVAAFLSWLIDGLRKIEPDCNGCSTETPGVPLARVWAEWTGSEWRIRCIKHDPPWRKMFDSYGPDDPFLATHYLDLPWWEVRRRLEQYGIELYLEREEPHLDPQALETKFQGDANLQSLTPWEPVVAVVTPWADGESREPHAGRVIRFRKFDEKEKPLFKGPARLRLPITKPGAGFDVTFHYSEYKKSKPPTFGREYGTKIPTDPPELEVGDFVDVVIQLNPHFDDRKAIDGDPEERQWKAFVYDELEDPSKTRRIRSVGEEYSKDKPIVWTIRVSDKLTPMLEFAVLLSETSVAKPREAAVWEPVEVKVIKPQGNAPGGGQAQAENNPTEQTEGQGES